MPALPFNGYYLTLALLAACTLFGIIVAAQFRREVDEDLAPTTTKDLLDPLEKAYYSGLMHPSEIEKIRESIRKNQPAKGTGAIRPRVEPAAGPGTLLADAAADEPEAPPADRPAEPGVDPA